MRVGLVAPNAKCWLAQSFTGKHNLDLLLLTTMERGCEHSGKETD